MRNVCVSILGQKRIFKNRTIVNMSLITEDGQTIKLAHEISPDLPEYPYRSRRPPREQHVQEDPFRHERTPMAPVPMGEPAIIPLPVTPEVTKKPRTRKDPYERMLLPPGYRAKYHQRMLTPDEIRKIVDYAKENIGKETNYINPYKAIIDLDMFGEVPPHRVEEFLKERGYAVKPSHTSHEEKEVYDKVKEWLDANMHSELASRLGNFFGPDTMHLLERYLRERRGDEPELLQGGARTPEEEEAMISRIPEASPYWDMLQRRKQAWGP